MHDVPALFSFRFHVILMFYLKLCVLYAAKECSKLLSIHDVTETGMSTGGKISLIWGRLTVEQCVYPLPGCCFRPHQTRLQSEFT